MIKICLASLMLLSSQAFAQELRPIRSSYKNESGTTTNFKPVVKGDKCISNSKYQRNDRDYHFNTVFEWDAVKDGANTRCINGKFTNFDSRNNQQIFVGKNPQIIVFVKGKAFDQR